MSNKIKQFFTKLYRRLKLIDWISAAFSILKASRKEDMRVDPKYIVVKPRILSDENYLRGVSMLRGVLTLIPPAAIAAPILGLGAMGFKIWKRIALGQEYDALQFPPVDPNMLRLSIVMDQELNKHYGQLIADQNWNDKTISELEAIYNDFQFLTNGPMLQSKYPYIDEGYIKQRTIINQQNLQMNLSALEQGLIAVSHKPEIEYNIRNAFKLLKDIFPAMNDWSLFNSEGFNDVLEILDTIF